MSSGRWSHKDEGDNELPKEEVGDGTGLPRVVGERPRSVEVLSCRMVE